MVKTVFAALNSFCSSRNLGEVFVKCPYVLTDDGEQLLCSRSPDVIFLDAPRWTHYQSSIPDWGDKPFMLAPDLAVEVIARDDLYADILTKANLYLNDGVRLVWMIDPWSKVINSYKVGKSEQLSGDDTLTSADVLPGFSLPLPDLFA